MKVYKHKRYSEWVFIYEGDRPILRMNDADFESDEEMEQYIEMVISSLNKLHNLLL